MSNEGTLSIFHSEKMVRESKERSKKEREKRRRDVERKLKESLDAARTEGKKEGEKGAKADQSNLPLA